MDVESARLIAKGLATITMGFSAIGEGILMAKAIEGMARNPEVADDIFTKMIIGVAMAESTAIYALVAFFIL